MNTKKVPMRTCVVTREQYPKKELIRVVRNNEGQVFIDLDEKGKSNGRGAYIKKDLNVILKAEKSKSLDQHLGVQVPASIYAELKELIK